MRACATAGGAVMFIPDTMENNTPNNKTAMSYKDLASPPKENKKLSALERLENLATKIAKIKKAA